MRRAAAVAILVCAGAASASEPVVAVMPFRDLATTRAPVGEAIRETLTVDLKESGVRVVERGAIDRAIAEQNLEDKKRDLPAIGAVRLGTLVGASWIVTGAYQRAGGTVRLTARVVDVTSGELRGSAKVDGASDELLGLQDRLASSLFASAGLPAAKVQKLTRRARPKVPYRALELYGDAVQISADDKKKRDLLQQAVAAGPQLSYAVRDLEALQQRMGAYSAVANIKLDERERALIARADDGKRAPAERAAAARESLDSLLVARRYHTLAEVALRWEKLAGMPELAAAAEFRALDGLHPFDAALAAGESYLRAFPTGDRYRDIESRMHEIVETRRKREARRAEYAADLAEKRASTPPNTPDHKASYDYAPCICARWNSQLNELMLDNCSTFVTAYKSDARKDVQENVAAARFFVVLALAERGDFDKARPLAESLLADSDAWDEELRKLIASWPTD